ncbi:MAG TPA: SHOCT domain-containing protein [Thermoleophilia bacterium]|nr:SHOCT domain-containing protein [Thermoleophilia bacterium]
MFDFDCFGATAAWFGGSTWGWQAELLAYAVHLIPLVLLGLALWLLLRASRAPLRNPEDLRGRAPEARLVLDDRYARGEISQEEYLTRRSDLT